MKKNSNKGLTYGVKLFVGGENGYLGNMKFVIICVIISVIITLMFMVFSVNLRRMKEDGIMEQLTQKSSISKLEQEDDEHGDEPDMSRKNNEKIIGGGNKIDGTIEKIGYSPPLPPSN